MTEGPDDDGTGEACDAEFDRNMVDYGHRHDRGYQSDECR